MVQKPLFYGENGFTFHAFTTLTELELRYVLEKSRIISKSKIIRFLGNVGHIEDVYLFPSFGRRIGFGEPDVVIVTEKYVIFVEVERDVQPSNIDAWASFVKSNTYNRFRSTALYQLMRLYSLGVVLREFDFIDQRRKRRIQPGAFIWPDEASLIRYCSVASPAWVSHIKKHLSKNDKALKVLLFAIHSDNFGKSICALSDCLTELHQKSFNWWNDSSVFIKREVSQRFSKNTNARKKLLGPKNGLRAVMLRYLGKEKYDEYRASFMLGSASQKFVKSNQLIRRKFGEAVKEARIK